MTSTPDSPGIPGLRGTDHIGFTVPDIEAATAFFVDVIGCQWVYTLDRIEHRGDWMTRHLNVHPRAAVREIRLLRCRHGSNFEIFEYEAPERSTTPPRNSDIGGHHLAFYVDDMDAAVAYLKARGLTVLGEPTRSTGASKGQTWVYFLAPWGMQLELVSFPSGKAYEQDAALHLWHPAHPEL